jgi:anti-anti-sigma factor
MTSWVESVSENDFAAQASANKHAMLVSLTGTADVTVRTQLDRFLREVHKEAQRRLPEEVMVDVRQLEFMNSSCLKCFVWWISTVNEQPGDGRYRIVFVSSPSVYWQRRSLNALACLANDIVSIQA